MLLQLTVPISAVLHVPLVKIVYTIVALFAPIIFFHASIEVIVIDAVVIEQRSG
jgi:hypothetical protein